MSCNIITQFKTENGRAADMIALLRKFIPESLHHAGCVRISIQQNQDDPNDIVSNQYWETRKHYEEYFAWRSDEGVTAQFQELCAEPISMRFFNEILVGSPPSESSKIESIKDDQRRCNL